MAEADGGIHIGVDVGGTFTDFAVAVPGRERLVLHKRASTPERPEVAIIEGIRAILEEHGLNPKDVRRIAHGTTVGTNALIQRRCGTVALVTSTGFRDLLEIGRQTRPRVYGIHEDHPPPLVPRELRFEVPCRRLADGRVHTPLDEAALADSARSIAGLDVDAVVVCFLHSYIEPADENRAVEILKSHLPDEIAVISSCSVFPQFREFERFLTAVINGALRTVIGRYLDRLDRGIGELDIPVKVKISQSSGGLMSIAMAREFPIRASLSGPAAGCLSAAKRAKTAGWTNVITLDAGGTSADVSLLFRGQVTEVHERLLAGFPIRIPALDVNAVGAGGGSIAWIDRDGLLKVGPHSAGADPGPACYDQGGTDATLTDANVVLGRLSGESLLDGGMPIKKALAEAAIRAIAERVGLAADETALGIVQVACSVMVKAVRSISIERGYDPKDFALFAFGGAGPLHAVDVARELGIGTVIVPPDPGILCADGALNSELTSDFVRTVLCTLGGDNVAALKAAREELAAESVQWFASENIESADRLERWSADLRYVGQNYELRIDLHDSAFDEASLRALAERFHEAHERQYGYASKSETVQVVNLGIKTIGLLDSPPLSRLSDMPVAEPVTRRRAMFAQGAWLDTPVYKRRELAPGQVLHGPALIDQLDATSLVFPGDRAEVDAWGNLVIALNGAGP